MNKTEKPHRYRELIDGCQVGGGLLGMGDKGEGIKNNKLAVVG